MKTVKFAQLHSDAFIAGLGSLGTTLPPTGKSYNLSMHATETVLIIEVDGGKRVVEIPLTNVKIYEVDTRKPELKVVK